MEELRFPKTWCCGWELLVFNIIEPNRLTMIMKTVEKLYFYFEFTNSHVYI